MSGTTCPGYNHAKPTRLRWLEPGRVKARPRRLERTPLNENESDYNETTTRAAAELARMANYVVGLPLEIKTKACALVQAAEYCK